MGIQSSMGSHKLDVRYGDRNALPYYNGILLSTLLTDTAIVASICAGRVYSLTTGGFLVPGLIATAGATGSPRPLFGVSGLDINNYPDVSRTRGMPGFLDKPAGGFPFHGVPVSAGLVGSFATIQPNMAGELSTTEFDQTAGATYAIGAPLTVVSAAATGTGGVTGHDGKTVRGLIRPIETAATDVIVGYVAAAGVFTGPEGYSTLAFIPAYVTVGATATVPNTEKADD